MNKSTLPARNDDSSSARPDGPSFVMLSCAHGAEGIVKSTIAEDGWRLSFCAPVLSRPNTMVYARRPAVFLFVRHLVHSAVASQVTPMN